MISTFAKIAAASILLFPALSFAQYDDYPPSRVARIGYTKGYVSFEPAGTDEWVDATINRPMTTGDGLWTDSGSRAALHIGSASINLSENTGMSFLNLVDQSVQIQLTVGTMRIRVKRLRQDENFEIDTPNLAFNILSPGIYRISVNQNGDATVIKDRRGEGEVTGGGFDYTVHAGELDTFSGTNQLYADVENINGRDDGFESWCQQRDHHEDISISARYMSDDAIGYDDLDDNGGWRSVPEYGMVWFPHVQNGWAPYHQGHWSYVAPWGYTWVDDSAWGFAPFHYGRWVYAGNGWGWVPCPPRPPQPSVVYIQPVYAPALVAWVGGFSGGVGVAWFALGPREVYVPSYPVNRTYFNNVNVSSTVVNTTIINNYYTNVIVNKQVNITNVTYVNQRVNGAVAATTSQAFTSGRPVATNAVKFEPRQVATAAVTVMTPPAVPQRESVFGGRAAVSVKPPAAVQARAVVVKTAPPAPAPPFERRIAAIQSNGGRPLSVAEVQKIAPVRTQQVAAPQIKIAPPAKPGVPRSAPPNRVNEPAPAARAAEVVQPKTPVPPPPPVSKAEPAARPEPAAIPQPPVRPETLPPTAHPVPAQLEQKHEQQSIDLHQKQDQQFKELQQQQQKQLQELQQQKADAAKQQQVLQQHQQQLEQLERQHEQQQQKLQQQQEAEHKAVEKQPVKPKPEEKPKEK